MANFGGSKYLYFCLVFTFASLYLKVDSRPLFAVESTNARLRRICKAFNDDTPAPKKFDHLRYSYEERRDATIAGWTTRKCPNFTAEYLRRQNKLHMRSISPYGPIQDYDPYRRPRVIIHHACLCEHCFNPATMKPNYNLASYNVTTRITVTYENRTSSDYDVITGCTCVVPKYRRVKK